MDRSLKLCIWSGPIGFGLFGLGLIIFTGMFPPPSPARSAADIAHIYQSNRIGIGLGSIVLMFAASMFAPFFAAMSVFVRAMERPGVAPYALTQAIGATVVVTFFFLGSMLLGVTAYRPDRPVELTYLMNDLTWIIYILPSPPAAFQTLAIGLAILKDPHQILPRWTGYFSLWTAVIFIPPPLGVLFQSGPFAWNGIFSFWIGAGIVGVWANIIAMQMLRAIKNGRFANALAQARASR